MGPAQAPARRPSCLALPSRAPGSPNALAGCHSLAQRRARGQIFNAEVTGRRKPPRAVSGPKAGGPGPRLPAGCAGRARALAQKVGAGPPRRPERGALAAVLARPARPTPPPAPHGPRTALGTVSRAYFGEPAVKTTRSCYVGDSRHVDRGSDVPDSTSRSGAPSHRPHAIADGGPRMFCSHGVC